MADKMQEAIAKIAYELFQRGGMTHGRDVENWLEAERIIRARYAGKEKAGKVQLREKGQSGGKRTEAKV